MFGEGTGGAQGRTTPLVLLFVDVAAGEPLGEQLLGRGPGVPPPCSGRAAAVAVQQRPLDPSALERDFPAVRGVRQVERRLGALEHVTFGGRPADGARGRIARVILEEDGDDCRD